MGIGAPCDQSGSEISIIAVAQARRTAAFVSSAFSMRRAVLELQWTAQSGERTTVSGLVLLVGLVLFVAQRFHGLDGGSAQCREQ
jgi:hypothetical protein